MRNVWSRLISAHLRFAQRQPHVVLLVATLVSAVGVWLGQSIQVNANLDALLPADSPLLPAIDEMEARVPSSSPFYLLVASDDPALNQELAKALETGVQQWPETRYALRRRDPSFFLDRRLLFLPAEDLRDLAYQVEDIVDFEECAAVPGCVNLDKRPPDPNEQALRDRIATQPSVKALLGLFGLSTIPDPKPQAPEGKPSDATSTTGPETAQELGSLCSPDGKVCAVTVFLDGSPSNLAYSERILAKTAALFEQVKPANAPPSLRLESSGPYRNAPATKRNVSNDLSLTAGLSTLLMVVLVALQFRGLRPFVLIFMPLLYAAAWTGGVVALVHPTLNVISAFTMAVLAGLGIDFGVHMLTHYGTERSAGLSVDAALTSTFQKLGGPMGMACITSGCGFGALMAADFRGFAEMGGMAAIGVALALLAFLITFPALVQLSHRIWPERRTLLRPLRLPLPRLRHPARLAKGFVIVGVLIAAGSALVGTGVSFEYDFRNLRPKTVSHGIGWKQAMHGTSRSAVVMLADTPEDLERTAAQLRQDFPERTQGEQAWLVTPASFIPEQQPERLKAIEMLRAAVQRAKKRLSAEEQAKLQYIEPLLAIEQPITATALPRWVQQWLTDQSGVFGTFGLMYTELRGSDARAMEHLANELVDFSQRYPEVRFASGEALLGLVVPGLRRDAPKMIFLALMGLFLGTILIGRSFSRAITVLLPLVLSTCCALALMVALDLKVNLYNMLVFPLSFGIGVDGAVYVVWAMSDYDPKRTPAALAVTARGVLGSTLTTAAGFGSMAVASNPGLVSLGLLAVTMLLCSLAGNLIWLPAFLYLKNGPPDASGKGLYLDPTSETRAL